MNSATRSWTCYFDLKIMWAPFWVYKPRSFKRITNGTPFWVNEHVPKVLVIDCNKPFSFFNLFFAEFDSSKSQCYLRYYICIGTWFCCYCPFLASTSSLPWSLKQFTFVCLGFLFIFLNKWRILKPTPSNGKTNNLS